MFQYNAVLEAVVGTIGERGAIQGPTGHKVIGVHLCKKCCNAINTHLLHYTLHIVTKLD